MNTDKHGYLKVGQSTFDQTDLEDSSDSDQPQNYPSEDIASSNDGSGGGGGDNNNNNEYNSSRYTINFGDHDQYNPYGMNGLMRGDGPYLTPGKPIPMSVKIKAFFGSEAPQVRNRSIEKFFLSPVYYIIFIALVCIFLVLFSAFSYPFGFRTLSTTYPMYPSDLLLYRSPSDPSSEDRTDPLWFPKTSLFLTTATSTGWISSTTHKYLYSSIPPQLDQISREEKKSKETILFPFLHYTYYRESLSFLEPFFEKIGYPLVGPETAQLVNPHTNPKSTSVPIIDRTKNPQSTSPNLSPMEFLSTSAALPPKLNPSGYITACLPPVSSPLFAPALRALLFISKRTQRSIVITADQPTVLTNSYHQSWGGRYSEAHWSFADFFYKFAPNADQVDEQLLKRVKNSFQNEARQTIPLFSRASLSFSPQTVRFDELFDLNSLQSLGNKEKTLQNPIELLPSAPYDLFQSSCVNMDIFHVCLSKKPISKFQADGVQFDTCDNIVTDSDSGYRCTNCPFHVSDRLEKVTYLRQQRTKMNPQSVVDRTNNSTRFESQSADEFKEMQNGLKEDVLEDELDKKNEKELEKAERKTKRSFLSQFYAGNFSDFDDIPYNKLSPHIDQQTKETLIIEEVPEFSHHPFELQITSLKDFENLIFRESTPNIFSSQHLQMIHLNTLTLATYGYYLEFQNYLRPNRELRLLNNFYPAFNNMVRFEALSIQQSLVGIVQSQSQPSADKATQEKAATARRLDHDGEYLNGFAAKPVGGMVMGSLAEDGGDGKVVEGNRSDNVSGSETHIPTDGLKDVPGGIPHDTPKDIPIGVSKNVNDGIDGDKSDTKSDEKLDKIVPDEPSKPDGTQQTTPIEPEKTTPTEPEANKGTNNRKNYTKDFEKDKNFAPDDEIDEWLDDWDPRHPNNMDYDSNELIPIEDESENGTIRRWWYDHKKDKFYEEETEDPESDKDSKQKSSFDKITPQKPDKTITPGDKISIINKDGTKTPIDLNPVLPDKDLDNTFDATIPPPRNQKLAPLDVASTCGLVYNIPPKSYQIDQLKRGSDGTLYQIAYWAVMNQCGVVFVHSHSLNTNNDNKYNRSFFTQSINKLTASITNELIKSDLVEPKARDKVGKMVITEEGKEKKQARFVEKIEFMWGCEKYSLCSRNVSYEFGITVEVLSALPHVMIHPANFAPNLRKTEKQGATLFDSLDPLADAILYRRQARGTHGNVSWINVKFQGKEGA